MSTLGQQLRPERRGGGQRRMDADRAEVGVQAEPATQGEERLLRSDRGVRVGPLRAADSAQQDRVGGSAGVHVLGPDGDPVRVDGGAADEELRPRDVEPERGPCRVDHAPGGGHDLRPDPVAGDRRDPIAREAALRHGSVSPWRGATNATDTPLISAPWSLLTATR